MDGGATTPMFYIANSNGVSKSSNLANNYPINSEGDLRVENSSKEAGRYINI